jgi:pimeloyl-ACP methyl ester carboxylesterase
MTDTAKTFEDITFSAQDSLKLYARRYPARRALGLRPVLCLAGLTRNSRDFHDAALALSQHPNTPRDVYTIDMRGRGLSEHDKDWRKYSIPVELQDVIDFMTMTGLHDAGIIGTSRGGLITHMLAAAQPTRMGAVVLNDIGPIIETEGLIRIAGYVGRTPVPKSWADAGRAVRELNRRDFPGLTDAGAESFAHQLFNERNGRPAPGYDKALSKCISVLDGPIPALWPQFEGLKRVPLLVIRGANSDLLSRKTVEEMHQRHPDMRSIEVPGEGHAPLLRDAPTIGAIAGFFAEVDRVERRVAA